MYVDGYTEGETDTYLEKNGWTYIQKIHRNRIDGKEVAHTMVGLVRVTPVGQVGDLEMQAAGDSTHRRQNYFSEKPCCLLLKPSPDWTRPTTVEVDSVQCSGLWIFSFSFSFSSFVSFFLFFASGFFCPTCKTALGKCLIA